MKSIRAPASSTPSSSLSTEASNTGLFNIAKAAGKKYFGTATGNPELTDAAYVSELSNINEFGQLTPVCLHYQRKICRDKLTFLKNLIILVKQFEMGEFISVGVW